MPKILDYKIPSDKLLYSSKELECLGISYYGIKKLIEQGRLIKLNSSIYENVDYQGEISDFYYVSAFAPEAVVCHMSAARYYGLTNYWNNTVDVAIERSKKISYLPDFPPLNVVYFSKTRYETGVEIIAEGNNSFRIYDMEKTVVDILFYRNKIGIEETKEVLTNYLGKRERNINKLHYYAKILRCEKILSTYLEVLI
jgi:predicted transcriptional regulator of viral defense system